MTDIYIYTDENLLAQIKLQKYDLGFYRVKFYVDDAGNLANDKTENSADFFLYPSGGTLRDSKMNIIQYNSKFDTYRGFIPPNK